MKDFSKQGFALVSRVLTSSECLLAREQATSLSYIANGVGVSILKAIQIDVTAKLIFNPALVESYKTILGKNIVLLPNITWRRNSSSPWHIDEAFRRPHADIAQNETAFLQCSVYLQANDQDGGGLDVIPRSHIAEHGSLSKTAVELARWLTAQAITVESASGDAVLWDGRLLHRSSVRRQLGRDNIAAHWTVARANAAVGSIFRHMLSRATDKGDIANIDRRYDVMKRFQFQQHASPGFLAAADAADIHLYDITRYLPYAQ
jgi:ectoine hydroxylase-related dioxygenase (phytanoyl-CoA dioxygenase family)